MVYTFPINSHHFRSLNALNEYGEYFWSNQVQIEYGVRFGEKFNNISLFFTDLKSSFANDKELYSTQDLINFASMNYSENMLDDAKNSVNPFWNKYIGIESQVLFEDLQNAIINCLIDLYIVVGINRKFLERNIQLTPKRTKKYGNINLILKSSGVHKEDRIVALDGHDFACKSADFIDFVTFDDELFRGCFFNADKLCFENIKGKHDFNT